MSVTKVAFTNTLDLVDRVQLYIDQKNEQLAGSGIELILADDQTIATRTALSIMEKNAALGLGLVLGVCWLFLGFRIAAFVTMGIAFSIAGTFWVLNMMGSSLNISVLLGIVIVLGMLVDDAVVVVEALYYRIQRGQESVAAALGALREVGQPVASAVFTTIAAFLPLMLLPGIVGDFMRVVPIVVTIGLLVSLIEAFWILPSHVIGITKNRQPVSHQLNDWRARWTHKVRVRYTRMLAFVFRRPVPFFAAGILAFALSIGAVSAGAVRAEFFVFDPFRLFYVNVTMPAEASLEDTIEQVDRVQTAIRPLVTDDELRALTGMAGIRFTDAEILYGDHYGQLQVALDPHKSGGRSVVEIQQSLEEAVSLSAGDGEISYFVVSGGPPVESDININVRGDDYELLRQAADKVKEIITDIDGSENIIDQDVPGRFELTVDLDYRAIRDAGLSPGEVSRLFRLHVDGEVIAFTRDQGEKIELRVRGPRRELDGVESILDDPVALPGGGSTTFRALTSSRVSQSSGTIKHFDFRRSITVKADLAADTTDTVSANNLIAERWQEVRADYPNIDLDFSGAFEDIQESLDAMLILFIFGIGLMYLILATQFRSYFQPLLILFTVPMAFTGVVFGLWITQYPLSLYTIYGIVALSGIAVNAAIVLIDATNARIEAGMRPLHAVMYAARRRVIPILMTSMTTIAGLFSLATGLGGKSALWGPVAASMVFGLVVGTILTLFLVPVLAQSFMRLRDHRLRDAFVGTIQKIMPNAMSN